MRNILFKCFQEKANGIISQANGFTCSLATGIARYICHSLVVKADDSQPQGCGFKHLKNCISVGILHAITRIENEKINNNEAKEGHT